MENLLYLAWLHQIWISQKKLHLIFEKNQNYKDFFQNLSYEKLKKFWIRENIILNILERKNKIILKNIEKKLIQRNVEIITIFDKKYPEMLKNIANPPFLFYLRWKIDNSPKFSVVWARKISSYGIKAIEKIIPDISSYFIIVSWWASWTDSFAHKITLENKKKTISIIWTWIDIDYPIENKNLYDKIVESGWAIISIFPIWEVWNPYNFPIRNELVAWISVWTLVIEAQKKSWSLITANLALDLWKDLFAIPGDIFKSNSIWTNNLIKNWMAKMVTNSIDILEEYNISTKNKNIEEKKEIKFENEIDEKIYNLLLLESLTSNELVEKLKIDISSLLFRLSMMEINWIIKKTLWWKFELK